MTAYVVDSSAVLAFLYGEKGGEQFQNIQKSAIISAVNFAEVKAKLLLKGDLLRTDDKALMGFFNEVVDFNLTQAHLTAELIEIGKPVGLSFGDRACLALALLRKMPVYTADRVWVDLKLPITIHLLRD